MAFERYNNIALWSDAENEDVAVTAPNCLVTVYNSGTLLLPELFADEDGDTLKGNPFTADADGRFWFYAPDGDYDVQLSDGGIPVPFTIGDVTLCHCEDDDDDDGGVDPDPDPDDGSTVVLGVGWCGGRLTLETGMPVTTSDVTGATAIYFTPYLDDSIPLWNGSAWVAVAFEELSLSLAGLSTGSLYDIFLHADGDVPTLELSNAWLDDHTPDVTLLLLNGVWVINDDPTRRYLGTFRATSAGTTEDSVANRFLWNHYNRRRRPMKRVASGGSHNYTINTTRYWANDSDNHFAFITGQIIEEPVTLGVTATLATGTDTNHAYVSVGLNWTSGEVDAPGYVGNQLYRATIGTIDPTQYPLRGYNDVAILERATAPTGNFFDALAWGELWA